MKRVARVWYSTTDLAQYFDGVGIPHRFMPSPVASSFFDVESKLPDMPHVLFAVPLNRLKGAETAIQAMRLLATEPGIRVSAFAYDTGSVGSQELRLQIPASVVPLGWTPHARMPTLFSSASVVVGSLGLGIMGVTELEAMAAGRPLIVKQREMSAYAPAELAAAPALYCKSPSEIYEAVMRCLTNKAYAQDLGNRSREWVYRRHSPEHVARLYEGEYRELVEGS